MSAPALNSNAMMVPPAALPTVTKQMKTQERATRLLVCANKGLKKSTLPWFSAASMAESAVTFRRLVFGVVPTVPSVIAPAWFIVATG